MAHPLEDIIMPCGPLKSKMTAKARKKNEAAKKKKQSRMKKKYPPKSKGGAHGY